MGLPMAVSESLEDEYAHFESEADRQKIISLHGMTELRILACLGVKDI